VIVRALWAGALAASVLVAGTASVDQRALDRARSPHLGLPPLPVPAENPLTVEKIALGRKLFFDRRLSFNHTMSCGMCHIPEQGFTNNELATPVGVEGRTVRRNSPTIVNSAYTPHMFHDGRDTSLETQIVAPLIAHNEMANPSIGYVIAKVERLGDYDGLFEAAFGGGPTVDRVGRAIAAWERTMIAANAPFDRWKYGGEADALSAEQKRGFQLFTGKGSCVMCHFIGKDDALFTDDAFHDTGIGYFSQELAPRQQTAIPVEVAPGEVIPVERGFMNTISEEGQRDLGRFEVTQDHADMWRFKTPSLRNVAVTAPYMHDGSLRTLEEVVRFYNRGAIPHEGLDPLLRPLGLTDDEVDAVVAFLRSLTSPDLAALAADARSVAVGN
jgi:cytochrome c peroxidase